MQGEIKQTGAGKRILRPIMGFLKAGIGPGQLAVAFALGMVVGIIPVIGVTTLLCTILAFTFRLNMPVLQLANYTVFPLQLLLFIPFFQLGGYLFEPLQIPASVAEISEMLQADFFGAVQLFWFANLQALLVWLLLAVPLFLILYGIFRLVFRRIALAFSGKGNKPALKQ